MCNCFVSTRKIRARGVPIIYPFWFPTYNRSWSICNPFCLQKLSYSINCLSNNALTSDNSSFIAAIWFPKINYRIHTDAIKEFLITPELTKQERSYTYANEADLLNIALFGKTAKQWREETGKPKSVNMRDFANVEQLIVLVNLESMNAELLRQNKSDYIMKSVYRHSMMAKEEQAKHEAAEKLRKSILPVWQIYDKKGVKF